MNRLSMFALVSIVSVFVLSFTSVAQSHVINRRLEGANGAALFAIFLPLVSNKVDPATTPLATSTPTPSATPTVLAATVPATLTPAPTLTATNPATNTPTPTPTGTATMTATNTPTPTATATSTNTPTTTPTSIPFPDITLSCAAEDANANNAKVLKITVQTSAPAPAAASFKFVPTQLAGPVDDILRPGEGTFQLVNIFSNESSATAPGWLAKCDTVGLCTATYTLTETQVTRDIGRTVDCQF